MKIKLPKQKDAIGSKEFNSKIIFFKGIVTIIIGILFISLFLPFNYGSREWSKGISYYESFINCSSVDWSANFFIAAFVLLSIILGLVWRTKYQKIIEKWFILVAAWIFLWITFWVIDTSWVNYLKEHAYQCGGILRFNVIEKGPASIIFALFFFLPLIISLSTLLFLGHIRASIYRRYLRTKEKDLAKLIGNKEILYKTCIILDSPVLTFDFTAHRFLLIASYDEIIIGANPVIRIPYSEIKEISFDKFFGGGIPYTFPIKLISGKIYKIAWAPILEVEPFSLDATERVYHSLVALWKQNIK